MREATVACFDKLRLGLLFVCISCGEVLYVYGDLAYSVVISLWTCGLRGKRFAFLCIRQLPNGRST